MKAKSIGKGGVATALVLVLMVGVVTVAITTYATMVGYLYVKPKPVPIWLTPTSYSLSVYSPSIHQISAVITNEVADKTFELATDISGYYEDPEGYTHDIFPYVKVVYLDYATRAPLPDADNDTWPEIFAPVGETNFYLEVAIEPIPDLKEGWVRVETALVEETP